MIKRKIDILLIAVAFILVIAVVAVGFMKGYSQSGTGTEFLALERKASNETRETDRLSTFTSANLDNPEITEKETPSEKNSEKTDDIRVDLRGSFNLGAASGLGTALTLDSSSKEFVEEKVETEALYFETIYEYTDELEDGEEQVYQVGVNGSKTVTYRYAYKDGELVNKEVISSKVLQEPREQIVLLGNPAPELPLALAAAAVEPPVLVTAAPTESPTEAPTETPTTVPTEVPTEAPMEEETTVEPTAEPTAMYTTLGDYLANIPDGTTAEAESFGFVQAGSVAASGTNFTIVASMLTYNGALNYISFTDNGNGTITVDGRTFPVQSGPISKRTTYYDGYECAKITGLENAAFSYNGYACNGTSTGLMAQRGIVSTAMYGGLPYGTVVFVEGYGLAVVGDIGGFGPDTLDLSLNAGEIETGGSLYYTDSRNVYIISIP